LALTVGSRLGPYEVLSLLGSGGMGEVYRARDTRLGRDVAIKMLPLAFVSDPDRQRRFEHEARATAALSHPNILAVFDVGAHEGAPYLVEELLEGESLRARLKAGPLPCRKAVEIAGQIAHGLAAAHARGILHRDLKPENVFVTRDGVVKILDFGLAKLVRGEDDTDLSAVPTATAPHIVLGTAPYMSPEQARGQPVDLRSDIFALGAVLYEMLSGAQAFPGASVADIVSAVLTHDPQPPSALRHDVPPTLDRLVLRCLEKRPEERFASARDLAFALAALATPSGASRIPARLEPPQDRPSIAVMSFSNLSADPEQEYFCDGVAEEIINALAHVERLRVVARTSSFAFKGRSEDVRQIGARLNVGAVLEGSVRKSGDRLRVNAQLIDVADGCHLWSERFDRRLEDVFAIQDEISLAIVEHLKVKLLARERAAVVHRHTESLDAHNAYLMGLFEWNKMSPEGLARCIDLYREAIRLDPAYARVYAHLADATASVTWWADQPPVDALSQALPLAGKALELDPDLALAHSVMGHLRAFLERDWTAGEDCLRRAVELAPNDAYAQIYLTLFLTVKGCHDEAALRARLAQRLDPLSPAINAWAGSFLVCTGHVKEALAALERQLAMSPHLWMPRYFLAHALAVAGRLAEARAAADQAVELSGGVSLTLSTLASICYLLGDRAAGDDLFDRLRSRAEARYVPPMLIAWLHIIRGEGEAALERVEEALEAKDPWVTAHRLYSPAIVPAEPRVDALLDTVLPSRPA
jgi:serine/threonine protein kinase/tetratricopeptide (TPR) repeat protein